MSNELSNYFMICVGLLVGQWFLIAIFYIKGKNFNVNEIAGFGFMFSIVLIVFAIAKYPLSLLNTISLLVLLINMVSLYTVRKQLR